MPYFDTGDCNLYYEIGDYTDPWAKPESVLLIHGFTESTPAWRAWVLHLARRYRVIRFDQEGFEWWVNLMGATRIETARTTRS
jgi:pimeloyl-ACP methyl ester carboxylesterase